MHEYPFTQQLLETVQRQARESQATSVTTVTLVVGDHSGVVGDSVQLFWEILREGTICENAELRVITVRSPWLCTVCGLEFERELFSFSCPECGADALPTKGGRECYIESIDVEP